MEAAVGFEPTSKGFADLSLKPLGYAAILEVGSIIAEVVSIGKRCGGCVKLGGGEAPEQEECLPESRSQSGRRASSMPSPPAQRPPIPLSPEGEG